jgi:hypothetical protein
VRAAFLVAITLAIPAIEAQYGDLKTKAKTSIMAKEDDVLAALDKPRSIYSLQKMVDPSNKNTEALQELLMSMRAAGKLKFDINTGHWRKA